MLTKIFFAGLFHSLSIELRLREVPENKSCFDFRKQLVGVCSYGLADCQNWAPEVYTKVVIFYRNTDSPTDQLNFIPDALWYREFLRKFQPS